MDDVKFCGFLKFGSLTLMPAVPACPGAGAGCPLHDRGRLFTSVTKSGTWPAALQFNVTRPRPLFAYALPIRMPGVGLVNTPIVPRTWFLLSPVGSQLNPSRGDQ